MNQLSFDFGEPAYPRFDKLLGTANAELVYILQQEHDQFVYLWGAQGSGKSHILQAWVGQALQAGQHAIYIDAGSTPLTDAAAEARFIAIDGIERLDSDGQAVLFYIFNNFRNNRSGHLLLAADVPPAKLQLREDLRTRMGYCLAYEVHALDRDEKIRALTHWRQDLNSLLNLFNTLADYSIAQGKPITLPLLRRLLEQQKAA